MSELPLVLTVEEAAAALRISRGAAYEAVRTNELPHVRIGRSIRIPRAGLLALLGEVDPGEPDAGGESRADPGRGEHSRQRAGVGSRGSR